MTILLQSTTGIAKCDDYYKVRQYRDPTPDYKLIKASEENGYTNVQFERIDITTEGDDKDVQFTVGSETYFISGVKNRKNTKSPQLYRGDMILEMNGTGLTLF